MAKSVSVLLAVFVLAVSLHATHVVSAGATAELAAVVKNFVKAHMTTEDLVKLNEKVKDLFEFSMEQIKKAKEDSKTPLPEGFLYATVTGINVGEAPVQVQTGSGVLIVSTKIGLKFLNKAAYDVLKQEILKQVALMTTPPTVAYGYKFQKLCYSTTDKLPQVTLVFTVNNGADTTVSNFSYKQNEETRCLAILPFK